MRLTATQYVLSDKRVPCPVRIAQVSDLHDCLFGTAQSNLLSKLKDFRPDAIVITGDLFNRHKPHRKENAFCFVKRALTVAPVYFAEGNHEVALNEVEKTYLKQLSEMGVRILSNEAAEQSGIRIIGLRQYATVEELSSLLDANRFNLVLSHRPERFSILKEAPFDLMLCGHAHGGQFRLGKRGLYAPQQGFFPKLTEGLISEDNRKMIVSRGLGNTVLVPRLLNPPELVFVTIHDCKECKTMI